MRLFIFPPSARVLAIVALKDYLNIECEIVPVDLSKGEQRTREYAARNPNQKMPMLEDDDFVLWELNAILFYLANHKPQSRLWPSDLQGQADVLRWLAWESAHWDAEFVGMVAYETASKVGTWPRAARPFVCRTRPAKLRTLRDRAQRIPEGTRLADRRCPHNC